MREKGCQAAAPLNGLEKTTPSVLCERGCVSAVICGLEPYMQVPDIER